VAKLLAQNSMLFLEVVDHVALLLVHPAGQSDQQYSERIEE
jgi:hypothetical protein